MSPQGQWSDVLSAAAGPLTQALGGNQQLAQTISALAQQISPLIPFSVAPTPPPMGGGQLAPQGALFGQLGALAGPLAQALGANQQQAQLAAALGQTAGTLLPWSVAPTPPPMGGGQLAPQGLLGGAFGSMAGGALGNALGGMLGNAGLGSQIGSFAGGAAGAAIPYF